MHCNIFIPNQELHSILETIHEVKKKLPTYQLFLVLFLSCDDMESTHFSLIL